MEVSTREDRGVLVVTVAGELALASSGKFYSATMGLRKSAGARVVLDLGGVTFVDSTGLGHLWKVVEGTRAEGGNAVLACVPPFVRRTFDLIGLSEEVAMKDTVDEAIGFLTAS